MDHDVVSADNLAEPRLADDGMELDGVPAREDVAAGDANVQFCLVWSNHRAGILGGLQETGDAPRQPLGDTHSGALALQHAHHLLRHTRDASGEPIAVSRVTCELDDASALGGVQSDAGHNHEHVFDLR